MTSGSERLDPRMMALSAVSSAGFALLVAIPGSVALFARDVPPAMIAVIVGGGGLLVVAFGAGLEFLRWYATRFQLSDDRLELHYRLIVTKRRSLARERIRTVDVTAGPIQRLFGLAKVNIGTGQHGSAGDAEVTLDPVSRDRAARLRVELLRRAEVPERNAELDGSLATLNWSWARFAPLSLLTPALGAAAVGAVLNMSSWVGRGNGDPESFVHGLIRIAALFGYLTFVLGVLVIGAVGALLLFVEAWWSYRLDREAGGTLHVRRGLLTTRSISLEERRLRGVEIVEPLGIRAVRGARVDAVATGMRAPGQGQRTDSKTLLPAAPRDVADRVAAAVLRENSSSSAAAALAPHPVAALGRRLRWAMATVAAFVVPLAVIESVWGGDRGARPALADVLNFGWIAVVVAIPVALIAAVHAYRNLGHRLADRYLLARRGLVRRSTVVLQRSGVIGWTVQQSIFQRRAGLLTLVATTAAGSGAYAIPDIDASDGLSFAGDAVPGLLAPFLERIPER